jgi:hypothetical protein
MKISKNKKNSRRTMDISKNEISRYFSQTGVTLIIKGHQDKEYVSFALKKKNDIFEDSTKYHEYGLKTLTNPQNFSWEFLREHIYAVITSTAVESKQLNAEYCFVLMNQHGIAIDFDLVDK